MHMKLAAIAAAVAVAVTGCEAGRPAEDATTARPTKAARITRHESALTETTSASVASSADKGRPFNRAVASSAIDASVARASTTCLRANGPTGKSRVVLTFGTDGTVSNVELEEPYAQTEVGSCLIHELESVSVAAFTLDEGKTALAVGKSFELKPAAAPAAAATE